MQVTENAIFGGISLPEPIGQAQFVIVRQSAVSEVSKRTNLPDNEKTASSAAITLYAHWTNKNPSPDYLASLMAQLENHSRVLRFQRTSEFVQDAGKEWEVPVFAVAWPSRLTSETLEVPKKSASQIPAGYFECTLPEGDVPCSDNECPCDNTIIHRGKGYLYISQSVVDQRRDAPSSDDIQRKVKSAIGNPSGPVVFSAGILEPILMCERGAKRRNLDLKIAAADAAYWWKTGLAPLRATPMAPKQGWQFWK